MKCFHEHTYTKLGFDVILDELSERLTSSEARARAKATQAISDYDVLKRQLEAVVEFKTIRTLEDKLPVQSFRSVGNILDKLETKGNWLQTDELARFWSWLKSILELRNYMHSRREEYPILNQLVNEQTFSKHLITEIGNVLDANGNLKENASSELQRIRRSIKKYAGELRATLYKILRHAQQQNWTQEKEITLRNDRLVIPVRAESKGRVPGFVQDVSQTGGTVYIEPTEALALNNGLKELKIKEQNEIIRILKEITDKVRAEAPYLNEFHEVMIEVELLNGKAWLAVDLDADLPVIVPEGDLHHVMKGYYPLLQLKEGQNVVPLELKLNASKRIIVISGPNAGGKSVALKTLGLLQLMLQAGFLVPASPDSRFRLFDSLFLDIGDEQSVDNDLSTYTSHLYQMRMMGDNMDSKSLFLIDEFGTGTDPKQGGAIAESFLERFVRQRAYGIITTHYGNLKDYAEITAGVSNAAMQFDTDGLKPTYRLLEGIPGRSYAFEMAKRVGVHYTILKKARKKVGTEEIDSEKMLRQLEEKNTKLSQLLAENKNRKVKLERLLHENEELKKMLDSNKKQILREAQLEAKELIRQTNKRIERTIREIKEKKAEQKETLRLRRALAASAPEVEPLEEVVEAPTVEKKGSKKQKKKASKEAPSIEIIPDVLPEQGDWIKVKTTQSIGQLVEIQGKKGVVESGGIRLTIKLDQLVKIKAPRQSKKKLAVSWSGQLPASKARFELEVIGKRVEVALVEVDKFMDDAKYASLQKVRILHGKGTGALREAIRAHVSKIPFVLSAKDAPLDQGGTGWTICELEE